MRAVVPAKLGFRLLAVKDNIVTDNFPTTCASKILQGYKSPFNAFVLRRNEQNGIVIYGKTNLDEFGMGSHSQNSASGPVVYNKFKERLSAGGSSGGSALAIGLFGTRPQFQSAGGSGVALGTDTGGSVRLPAAYTGVIGFKPSYGILSRHGVVPYANSLDTVGILASTVKDMALFFKEAFGVDDQDPSTVPDESRYRAYQVRKRARSRSMWSVLPQTLVTPRYAARLTKESDIGQGLHSNLRIGVPIEYNIDELAPEVREAWHHALWLLERHGCTIVPISLPNTKHALSAYYVIAPAEASSNLAKYDGVRYGTRESSSDSAGGVLYSQTRDGFGDEVKRRILLGSYTLSSEAIDNYFIKAQKVRRLVRRDFDRVFAIPNPLRDPTQYDLSDMDESILLKDKLGPPQVDFIVCPTTPTTSPTLDSVSKQTPVDSYMNDIFTVPASLAGLPAISVPMVSASPHSRLKPIGIQIIGQYSDDNQVLAVADTLIKLKKLKERFPNLRTKMVRRALWKGGRWRGEGVRLRKVKFFKPVRPTAPLKLSKFITARGRWPQRRIKPYRSAKLTRFHRIRTDVERPRKPLAIHKKWARLQLQKFRSLKGDRRLIRHRRYDKRADRSVPYVADTLSRWEEIPSDDESRS